MERKYYTEEQILEALSEVGVGAGDTTEVLSYLGRLPSEEKTGKWIYDKYYLVHVCSECDEQALEEYTVNPRTLDRDYDEVLSEYCPHCGSRMLEIEEEEDDE